VCGQETNRSPSQLDFSLLLQFIRLCKRAFRLFAIWHAVRKLRKGLLKARLNNVFWETNNVPPPKYSHFSQIQAVMVHFPLQDHYNKKLNATHFQLNKKILL